MDILLEGGSVLHERDYTLIIDCSQSMATLEKSEGKNRWELVQESILAIASYCEQYDPDGITLYLFSDQFERYEKVTSDKVIYIFQHHQPAGKNRLSPARFRSCSFPRRASSGFSGWRAPRRAWC